MRSWSICKSTNHKKQIQFYLTLPSIEDETALRARVAKALTVYYEYVKNIKDNFRERDKLEHPGAGSVLGFVSTRGNSVVAGSPRTSVTAGFTAVNTSGSSASPS